MYIDVVVQHDPDLNMTDQIQVPLAVWEQYVTSDDTPTFMRVNGSAVGRIVPAEIQNACRIPAWIWSLCGEVDFVELEPVVLPIATSITLKPRIQGAVDLETMSAAISASWACLSVGATLQLVCGTYDIIAIHAADTEVPAACILDCDVELDLVAFSNEVQEETHIEPALDPVHEVVDFSQMFTPKADPKPDLFPGQGRTLGGQGRRLG